jgi:hypothetical protein
LIVDEACKGTLLIDMAHTLRAGPKGQWWWPEEEGAMGQALHTGLWLNTHGNSISVSMPRKEGAQLYATSYWNRGVLLASTMQCREAMATVIRDLDLPTHDLAHRQCSPLSTCVHQTQGQSGRRRSPWLGRSSATLSRHGHSDRPSVRRGSPVRSAKTASRAPTCHATEISRST